jgi:RNA binding exosome subunit
MGNEWQGDQDPLLPEDYVKIKRKQDILETKYGMPITILGGNRALNEFLHNNEEVEKEDRETILADLNDVFQSEE